MPIELAPSTPDALRTAFGCSRRLVTRILALHQRGLALSALVVEEARPGSLLESLLMERALLEGDTPATPLSALLETERFAPLQSDLSLVVIGQDGMQVLAAEEETLLLQVPADGSTPASPPSTAPATVDAGSGSPGRDPASVTSAPSAQTGDTALARRADGTFVPASAPASGRAPVYGEEELARIRVRIFASPTAAEKIAALRQFGFSNSGEEEKIRVFLQATGDEDAALRAAAAQGMRELGVEADVCDAARTLAEGSSDACAAAAARLADLGTGMGEGARDLVLMACFGSLRDPRTSPALRITLYATLRVLAPVFGIERVRASDFLRILTGLLRDGTPEERSPLRGLLRAMDALDPGWVAAFLGGEILRSRMPLYRAHLFDVLEELPSEAECPDSLLEAAAETWTAIPTDAPAFRRLGMRLIRHAQEGLPLFLRTVEASDTAHIRAAIRLLDNALLGDGLPPPSREAIARMGLTFLRSAPLQVRTDLLETSLCVREDLPPGLRREIADVFLRDLNEYAQWPLTERLEHALVRLGAPVVPAIARTLSEQRHRQHAAVLAQALGRIGLALDPRTDGTDLQEVEAILRNLTALSFEEVPIRDALHVAIGRLASRPGLRPDTSRLVYRTLLERLRGDASDAATLEALGLCCSGTGLGEEELRVAAQLCLRHLQGAMPEPEVRRGERDGEDVFLLGGELDVYATLIPACLRGLCALFTGKRTTRPVQEEILGVLLPLRSPGGGVDLAWGPGNAALLTEILGRMGADGHASDRQRFRIVSCLAPRAADPPVLEALATILARPDPLPQHDRIAGTVMDRVLRMLTREEDMKAEDATWHLGILARLARRGRFSLKDGGTERLLERVAEQFESAMARGVPRATEHARRIVEEARLPEAVLRRLAEAVARQSQLTVTRGQEAASPTGSTRKPG